jgi:hypothetical protein
VTLRQTEHCELRQHKRPLNDLQCSRECKKSKLQPQPKTVSNQPLTISLAPKPLHLDPSTTALPTGLHPPCQLCDCSNVFFPKWQPTFLSINNIDRESTRGARGPRSPRGTVGPSGLPNPPAIKSQAPGPCLLFRASIKGWG